MFVFCVRGASVHCCAIIAQNCSLTTEAGHVARVSKILAVELFSESESEVDV